MQKMFSLSKMFFDFFFAHENMKKPASKVAKPAQILPKSHFLFHKNLPPHDFSIMTLAKRNSYFPYNWFLRGCKQNDVIICWTLKFNLKWNLLPRMQLVASNPEQKKKILQKCNRKSGKWSENSRLTICFLNAPERQE